MKNLTWRGNELHFDGTKFWPKAHLLWSASFVLDTNKLFVKGTVNNARLLAMLFVLSSPMKIHVIIGTFALCANNFCALCTANNRLT